MVFLQCLYVLVFVFYASTLSQIQPVRLRAVHCGMLPRRKMEQTPDFRWRKSSNYCCKLQTPKSQDGELGSLPQCTAKRGFPGHFVESRIRLMASFVFSWLPGRFLEDKFTRNKDITWNGLTIRLRAIATLSFTKSVLTMQRITQIVHPNPLPRWFTLSKDEYKVWPATVWRQSSSNELYCECAQGLPQV